MKYTRKLSLHYISAQSPKINNKNQIYLPAQHISNIYQKTFEKFFKTYI